MAASKPRKMSQNPAKYLKTPQNANQHDPLVVLNARVQPRFLNSVSGYERPCFMCVTLNTAKYLKNPYFPANSRKLPQNSANSRKILQKPLYFSNLVRSRKWPPQNPAKCLKTLQNTSKPRKMQTSTTP